MNVVPASWWEDSVHATEEGEPALSPKGGDKGGAPGGKGAAIGALAGAGAGTAGSAVAGNKEILLPAETLVTFRLEHSVHVTQ